MRLDTNAAISSHSDMEITESNTANNTNTNTTNNNSNSTTTTGYFDNIPGSANLGGQQTIRDQTVSGEAHHHSSTEEEDDEEDDEDRDMDCDSPTRGLDQENFGNATNCETAEENEEQYDKLTDTLYNSQFGSTSSNNSHPNTSIMENNSNIPTILEEDAENTDLVSIDSNDDLVINNNAENLNTINTHSFFFSYLKIRYKYKFSLYRFISQ
ncbi:unnamed protein product [[Candida] boidinii]|nr:unnamed protein product [[Candida] boidinii]